MTLYRFGHRRDRPGRLDGDPLPARHLGRSATGLAHLPAIAHNLLRAAGSLASLAHGKARSATLRLDLIDVAARTARPRAHHVASTRRLAPRAGIDEPVHRGLGPRRDG
jgi:hypothetical protein